jgi:hypothetical protein
MSERLVVVTAEFEYVIEVPEGEDEEFLALDHARQAMLDFGSSELNLSFREFEKSDLVTYRGSMPYGGDRSVEEYQG